MPTATATATAERDELAPAPTTPPPSPLAVAPRATADRPPDPDLAAYSMTRLRREVARRKAATRAATLTPVKETSQCIAGLRRQIRSLAKRVGALDIDQLAELHALTEEMNTAYRESAWLLHKSGTNPRGYSWQEIADALGITKPTCWRQFRQAPEGTSR